MRSWNKRGLELAASTIITIIVGVVILTLAMGVSYSAFCGAEDYAAAVDSQSEQRIEQLLAGGGKVQVADNTKTAEQRGSAVCGREPVASAMYTLGIKNVESATEDFKVEVLKDGDVLSDTYAQYDRGTITIAGRQTHVMKILIIAPDGLQEAQFYSVKVSKVGGPVYRIQQIYLEPA